LFATAKGFLVNQDRALFLPQDGAPPAVLEEKRVQERKAYACKLARLAGFEPATYGLEVRYKVLNRRSFKEIYIVISMELAIDFVPLNHLKLHLMLAIG
jgi:hypothetical protein